MYAIQFRNILKRSPFIIAALWSIGASIYLLFAPFYMVHTVSNTNIDGQWESVEQVRRATLYEANGFRIIIILLIFTLLFCSTAVLAVKDRYIPLAVLSLLATTLTILGMLTIGITYLPAVVAVAAGWILIALERLFRVYKAKD